MSLSVRPLLSAFVLLGTFLHAAAQNIHPQADRIAAHADLHATTRLAGHIPAWASAANDAGSVSGDTALRLTFVLSRSPERQAAFTQLLADQQNPASPSYHHWLTPQQIGTLYGPTRNDLNTLSSWLTAQGFAIKELAPSHTFVTVEAPASTVADALGTTFHKYNLRASTVGTAPRIAATNNPAIPTPLAAIVSSIIGLADTPIVSNHLVRPASVPSANSSITPDLTNGNGSHNIMPSDFAVIYDINPVYNSGIDGTGQKIAIIGRSRVLPADITNLENFEFTSPNVAIGKLPNTIIPTTGVDPGMTGTNPSSSTNPDDQGEATIDVSRAIATAPGAQVDLVVSGSLPAYNGVYIAAQYEVDTLRDPVMNVSFSACEANDPPGITGVNGFWNTLFAQAAAQGITVIASSGDSGAAQCETAGQLPSAAQVRSINDICASSYVTCVGGTEFADTASPSTYWNSTNGNNFESALSYIPEGAWNESNIVSPAAVLGTGGGVSTFIPKPVWQTGPGVPADNFRDVPDISFASSAHDGYLVCLTYIGKDCTTSGGSINIYVGYGTSTAAPAMAAIAALLNQKSNGAQGNLNPLLYNLAVTAPSVFHDATPATSGVTCDINTPSMCNNSTPGLAGYALTTGYDQATGLGSLDVDKFLSFALQEASFSISAASPTITASRGDTPTDLITVNSFAYTGNVSLGCTVAFNGPGTATSFPICSLSAGTVGLTGSGSATSTLSIATSTPVPALAIAAPAPHPASRRVPFGRIALGSFFLLALLPARRYRHSLGAWQSLPGLLLLFTALGALSACSGSSTPLSPNPLLTSTSSTTIAAAASGVFAGATDTFTASVANSGFNTAVAPTGTVQFFQNGTPTAIATATLVNGVATTAPVTFSTPGNYTITATYVGDNNFSTSSSSTPLSVQPRGTTLGSYTVTVNATGSGGLSSSTAVAITVQ